MGHDTNRALLESVLQSCHSFFFLAETLNIDLIMAMATVISLTNTSSSHLHTSEAMGLPMKAILLAIFGETPSIASGETELKPATRDFGSLDYLR